MGRNQGIKGKNVTNRAVRYGQSGGAREIHVKAVAQSGTSIGNHITGRGKNLTNTIRPLRGDFLGAPVGTVKLGNEIAGQTVCQPGGSRTVLRSSTQGQHGPVAGSRRPQGRGILNNE